MQKNNQKVNVVGTVAAGVAGAAIGAAAAVIFSDKEKRKTIVHTVKDLQQKGEKLSEHARTQAESLSGQIVDKTENIRGKVKNSARSHLKK